MPAAVGERLVERLAERDADVLDRVVGAGLEVAARLDPQPEAAVAAEQLEHVVEEPDPGRGRDLAAVERQLDRDLGLARLALDVRRSAHRLVLACADSPWTGKPSASAIAATWGARASAASRGMETTDVRRMNAPGPSGPPNRAAPPVGSTWFEPAA